MAHEAVSWLISEKKIPAEVCGLDGGKSLRFDNPKIKEVVNAFIPQT